MTNPTRPTDAELEAGHARLLAAWSKRWPELAAYYEGIRASTPKDGFVWMATQIAKPPRVLTVEELQRSHDIAAKQREGRTLRASPFKVPVFIDIEGLSADLIAGMEAEVTHAHEAANKLSQAQDFERQSDAHTHYWDGTTLKAGPHGSCSACAGTKGKEPK